MSTTLLSDSPPIPPPDLSRGAAFRRHDKLFVLAAVGIPTLIILGHMSGFVRNVGLDGTYPFLHLDLNMPAVLFANTPTGGDMGAHVLLPQILRDELLPSGRIIGWSDAWYAGFPALYFYFPLPALFTVLADVVIPYGVAFKLGAIVGLVLLPVSVYVLVRGLGFSRVVAGFGAFGGSMFTYMESFAIYGGNIKSTLAGEFSFSWSLALSLMYLGIVVRSTREDRPFSPLAGVLLALTALSHVVTTAVVVMATLPLLLRRNGARVVGTSWALGLALSAFWAIPLAVRGLEGFTTDMGWSPVTGMIGETSSPGIVATPFPDEFVPIAAVALVGLVWCLIRREDVSTLAMMTIAPMILYWAMPLTGFTRVYNGRLLPFWYIGGFILAGIALGLAVTTATRVYPQRRQAFAAASTVALLVPAGVALFGIQDSPGWVNWNFTGYEGKAGYPQYQELMREVSALPPGRVMWEHNADVHNAYGTPMVLMLLPYWSPDHPSMEGVFFESSITTPFHFLNQSEVSRNPSRPVRWLSDRYSSLDMESAIDHLALYDVEYYISVTEEAHDAAVEAGLTEVANVEPWTVFRLPESSFVDVATRVPVVYNGDESFTDVALDWYDDPRFFDYWVADDGPADWPRVSELGDRFDHGEPIATTGTVSDIVVDNDTISFSTTAIGVPHMVKMSYFPNWRAVEGAEGVYHVAPSVMVVVPTAERVVLQFGRTWVEYLGNLLTLAGLVVVAAWAWRKRREAVDRTEGT